MGRKKKVVDPSPFYFLNGFGIDGSYDLYRFDRFGFANPPNAVIGPLAGNAGSGITLVAQPSAVKLSDRIRVFATRFNGTLWTDIAYWDSFDGGVTFGAATSVITAASIGATFGLVDATLYVVPGDATPFKMIFGIRASNGVPATLTLATSANCASWTVQGTVFTKGADTWQVGGIVPSYVYKRPNGNWAVMLNTYNASLAQAAAAFAEATSPNGPFGAATLIASPFTTQVGTLTGTAGQNTGTSSLTVRLNEPYLVYKSGDQAANIVTPIAQAGTTITFDLPLPATVSGVEFAHVAANTIDPSLITENADGSCTGIFTTYKAFSDVLCEYTVSMSAPALAGTWSITSGKVVFQPTGTGNHHINSTENPAPIIDASGII
ncbi:hypothetical protein [Bradyrhizobium sp. th.b2]|uniref:hypothetical protein n=1 Tax=Bradyrhizobium sp. th-b2 TaxID=172088 RepID=UPI0003F5D198|nr:hypothetical protein [Bradyrhizobium sp. th.b2]